MESFENFISSELFSTDCFPHRAVLEGLPGLERLKVYSNDFIDRGLSDFFGLLSLESFILPDECFESAVTNDVVDEEVPDCVLIVHVVPCLVGVTSLLYPITSRFARAGAAAVHSIHYHGPAAAFDYIIEECNCMSHII